MVSASRLEVVFSKCNVCFGGVIVSPGDGGLVDGRRLKAVSIERSERLIHARFHSNHIKLTMSMSMHRRKMPKNKIRMTSK